MMRIVCGGVLILSLAISSTCLAATVASIQGQVSFNTGSGFRPLVQTTDLQPGARVMAGENSAAQVTYSDGCRVVVRPSALYTFAVTSPCASGAVPTAGETGLPQPDFMTLVPIGFLGGGFGIACATGVICNRASSP